MKLWVLALAALLVGCIGSTGDYEAGPPPAGMQDEGFEQPVLYSLDEIAEHASSSDCWMAIDGMVYDATPFVSSHPGGQTILEGCGTDATELFETRPMGSGTPHSGRARNILNSHYIGDLQ